MGPCIAYQELVAVLELNFLIEAGDNEKAWETGGSRLEWLLRRHNTDGRHGCDWCVLAEEIRRLRAARC
jgi:hypothetical protein